MLSAWSRRLAPGVFAVALAAYACAGGAPATSTPKPTPDAGVASVATTQLKFDVSAGLECAGGSGICVAPSQIVTFGVEAVPGTKVTLSLQGSYADAALTAQEVTLGASAANVTLESASTTAKFSIVATVGGPGSDQSVSLPVTVSQSGSATIEATPTYSGHRPDTELYATDYVLSTCAEITADPPDASAVTWTSAAADAGIPLAVPAGERVAVDVRIGHYAFGCADVDPLIPNTTSVVPVQIYDVPMALSLTNLNVVLSFTPDGTAEAGWHDLAAVAAARIEAVFFSSSESDGSALLDAMSAAIVNSADQEQFAQLRTTNGWDPVANTWMSSHTPSLGSRAATWLTAATNEAIGPLNLSIGNEPSGETTAPVSAVSFGQISWAKAGISQPAPFLWTADANDTVHLSGAIDLRSTPLFAHEADALAAAAVTSASDVPSAIATGIDCAGFASSVVGSGVSYGTCSSGCTANLCRAALTLAWTNAALPPVDGADVIHTTITASAPASVGDLAEPNYAQGGWVGSISGSGVPTTAGVPSDDGGIPITGTLLATEPAP